MDEFYTPKPLAEELVGHCRVVQPTVVADFTMGGGSLLNAANVAWPNAKLFGNDIDKRALSAVSGLGLHASGFRGDFLSKKHVARLYGALEIAGHADVILLNPPFSCKGSTVVSSIFEDAEVQCSRAMAFLLGSCVFLKEGGEILGIVPRSCLRSEKDGTARELLRRRHFVEDLGEPMCGGFKGASVSVHIVRIRHRPTKRTGDSAGRPVRRLQRHRQFQIFLTRGGHALCDSVEGNEGISLVHTTELKDGRLLPTFRTARRTTRQVSGRILLLPRVGRPSSAKLVLTTFKEPVVLSDCIVGIKTMPEGHESQVATLMRRFWPQIEDLYSGTCARYVTLKALQGFFRSLGFEAQIRGRTRVAGPVCGVSMAAGN